jgi:hypothetical protein
MSNFTNLHLPREVRLPRNDAASSQFRGNYEHHLADTQSSLMEPTPRLAHRYWNEIFPKAKFWLMPLLCKSYPIDGREDAGNKRRLN